ncbi:5'-deoxyadenosine deaminase [Halobacterium salinarum]|uniref:5'-deoxyadenosine deaminase n=1 Tax=Halobacterium salinarum TaxID=2242 RepID=UPI00255607D0|nr:5'-deoxyadenosine deaminase [Halobacterium salinarum]MDL0124034.1 5'-deoxyadenosine deaminase [Halobacterium salinarum]WJK63045.1 5'-deoxyadenosine deaminase [Halobacterium salinarum]
MTLLTADTVVQDADRVLQDGAVVVVDDRITAVGDRAALADAHPDHERIDVDVLAPGLVGAHVHSVQSLGRGIADDQELLDWLFDHVLPMEAGLDAAEMRAAADLAYLEFVESGTTGVVDHLSVDHAGEAFGAAADSGVRARLGKVLMDKDSPDGLQEDTDAALAETEALIREWDGACDGRIQYAITPRFAVSCTEACLRGCRALADEYGVRIHTHASENQGEIETVEAETGKRNIHWLDDVGLTGEDVVLAHCVWTDDSERALLAETGTHVTHCPSSNMKLASGVAPVADYRERGINVALGTDGPPCNNTLDGFAEMRQASLLGKVDALDPTALPARSVFEMATHNGAKAAGFENVGRIAEGWTADLVGLSTDAARSTPIHDPYSHLVYAAHGDDVTLTMVAGDVLYRDGAHVRMDAPAIRERAREFAAEL